MVTGAFVNQLITGGPHIVEMLISGCLSHSLFNASTATAAIIGHGPLRPNYDDFSCRWRFGVEAPPLEEDEAVMVPCFTQLPQRVGDWEGADFGGSLLERFDGAKDCISFFLQSKCIYIYYIHIYMYIYIYPYKLIYIDI